MTDLTPYVGCWVALVGEQVAGVGYTAEEALRLAQRNRSKERFTLRFVEQPGGEGLSLSPLLDQLRPLLIEQDQPVFLVGGAVRDALLNRVSQDLDFVVPHGAIQLAFRVADMLGVPAYALDKKRDTGRVMLPEVGTTLDFARYRDANLEADLCDRDFTINAMALPATAVTRASLIDPCQGIVDLQAGLIRQTHDEAIAADPVRALRALRLAFDLDFTLAVETAAAVAAAAPLLENVSAERVRDELLKLVQTAVLHEALRLMADLGLLAVTLPKIAALQNVEQSPPHHEPVLAHTFSVLKWLVQIEGLLDGGESAASELASVADLLAAYRTQLVEYLARRVDGGVNGRTLLRLGAVFHDVGKAETQTTEPTGRIRFLGHEKAGAKLAGKRLRRLSLSNQAIKEVQQIVAGHMRPLFLANAGHSPSRRAIFRFFRDTGSAGLSIGLLALADNLATEAPAQDPAQWQRLVNVVATLFQHYFDNHAKTVAPPPLLRGQDLMAELQIEPGPEIGRLLRLIQEGQAAGELTTREEALQFARRVHQ